MASGFPKISLIATFYNAEAYLDRCVESLHAQTHGDYEIVLVDDGSTDGTFEKLVRYADGDKARAVHKPNGGPGDARNHGVACSRGKYVSFVDGDDWISPYYLDILDLALLDHRCEHAIGAHRIVRSGGDVGRWSDGYHSRHLSREEAIEMLLYEELTESPCGKLAPRALYESYPFPERRYEDVAIASAHYLASRGLAWVDVPIYAYRMRAGSIVHKSSAPIEQLEDFEWAIGEFLDPLEERFPQLTSALAFRRALECARAHSVAAHVGGDAGRAGEIDASLIAQVRSSVPKMAGDARVRRRQLYRFKLLASNPQMYDALFHAYEKLAKREARA